MTFAPNPREGSAMHRISAGISTLRHILATALYRVAHRVEPWQYRRTRVAPL